MSKARRIDPVAAMLESALSTRVPRAEIKEVSRGKKPVISTRLDLRKHCSINWICHFHTDSIVRKLYAFF